MENLRASSDKATWSSKTTVFKRFATLKARFSKTLSFQSSGFRKDENSPFLQLIRKYLSMLWMTDEKLIDTFYCQFQKKVTSMKFYRVRFSIFLKSISQIICLAYNMVTRNEPLRLRFPISESTYSWILHPLDWNKISNSCKSLKMLFKICNRRHCQSAKAWFGGIAFYHRCPYQSQSCLKRLSKYSTASSTSILFETSRNFASCTTRDCCKWNILMSLRVANVSKCFHIFTKSSYIGLHNVVNMM